MRSVTFDCRSSSVSPTQITGRMPLLECVSDLGRDVVVGFAEQPASLRVAHQHPGTAQVVKHRAETSPVNAPLPVRATFCAPQVTPVSPSHVATWLMNGNGGQTRPRRGRAGAIELGPQRAQQPLVAGDIAVHFPVADDDRTALCFLAHLCGSILGAANGPRLANIAGNWLGPGQGRSRRGACRSPTGVGRAWPARSQSRGRASPSDPGSGTVGHDNGTQDCGSESGLETKILAPRQGRPSSRRRRPRGFVR